jgi:hypothetical protein
MCVFLLAGLAIASDEPKQPYQALPRLAEMMSGSFSSAEQAAADTSFQDVRVQMMPVWQHLSSAFYIYAEHAGADRLNLPFRQRVYRLTQLDDSTISCETLEFKVRAKVIGAWKKFSDGRPNPGLDELNSLTPSDLVKREGCTLLLHPEGDSAFVGSTNERDCVTKLRGASYMTTEFRMTKEYMYNWDRGFDSTGTQVWGMTKGGYTFKKVRE